MNLQITAVARRMPAVKQPSKRQLLRALVYCLRALPFTLLVLYTVNIPSVYASAYRLTAVWALAILLYTQRSKLRHFAYNNRAICLPSMLCTAVPMVIVIGLNILADAYCSNPKRRAIGLVRALTLFFQLSIGLFGFVLSAIAQLPGAIVIALLGGTDSDPPQPEESREID